MRKLTLIFLSLCPLLLKAAPLDSLLEVKEHLTGLTNKEKADLYNELFKTYLDENVDSALYYGKLAEQLCTKTGYEKGLASYYNNQGIYNKNIGNYYTALLWYHKYLEKAEKLKDKKSIASAYNNIGIVYKMQENPILALAYFDKSLQMKKAIGAEKDLASTLNNIGNVFIEEQKWDSSLRYYFIAKELNSHFGKKIFLCVNLRNIAEVYIKKNQPDSSLQYIKQAEQLIRETSADNKQLSEWYNLLALYYYKTKKFGQALIYADSAERIVKKGKFRSELLDVYRIYSDIYNEWGDHTKAFQYEKNYNLLRDSMYKESISVQVTDLQQSYELKKLDGNLDRLRQQKYSLVTIAVLTGLLLALAIYYLQKRKQTIGLLDLKNKELSKLNEEKNELIRLVAHDLKSPLSRINMLAQLVLRDTDMNEQEKDQFTQIICDTSKESLEMIHRFLSLERSDVVNYELKMELIDLREFLQNKIERFIPLAREKKINLSYHIALNQTHISSDLQCLRQIISNLISNAIKYTPFGGIITINLIDDDTRCIFEIQDSGPGIPEQEIKTLFTKLKLLLNKPTGGESSTGFGLFIVKSLSDRIGAEVWVKSKQGEGASFFLGLPKNSEHI